MLEDDKTVVGDLDRVIKKLEGSNRATSIKQMRNIRMRIATLQEGGKEIPEELAEAYNRLAVETNKSLEKNADKMSNARGALLSQFKDGIGDLANGVEGIFGDVLSQLTNNPLFTFAKGFVKSSFGILAGLIPSFSTGSAELIDNPMGDRLAPDTPLNQDIEYLKSIDRNMAGLLGIWQDNNEILTEGEQGEKLNGDGDAPILPVIAPVGIFAGFLTKLAATIRVALFGGAIMAFLMNPLTLGIAALTLGLGLLYTKWDDWNIGEKLSDLPGTLSAFWNDFGLDFAKIVLGVFVKIGDTIGNAIGSIFGEEDIFKNLGVAIGGFIFDAIEGVKEVFTSLGTDIGVKLFDIVEYMKNALGSVFSFMGIGEDKPSTVDEFTSANEDKDIPDLMDKLAQLQLDNSNFWSMWTDKELTERDALQTLLDAKRQEVQLARTIQESGESRNQTGSNVTIQNNANSTVTNTAVGGSDGSSPVASSRSNSGAYMSKKLGNNS